MSGTTPAERAKRITSKFIYHPVLPVLGWTKATESVVAGGPAATWVLFAALVTVVWVFGRVLYRRLQDTADGADDALDGVTDGGDP